MRLAKASEPIQYSFLKLPHKATDEERTKRANAILKIDFPGLEISPPPPADSKYLAPYPILTGTFEVSKREILKALLNQLNENLFPGQPVMVSRVREVAGNPELRMVISPYECQ